MRGLAGSLTRRIAAVVSVSGPALHGTAVDEHVPRTVTEPVPEGKAVCLPIAGEAGGEPLSQRPAALFQDERELLDTGGPEYVVEPFVGLFLSAILPKASSRVSIQRRRQVVSMLTSPSPHPGIPRIPPAAASSPRVPSHCAS